MKLREELSDAELSRIAWAVQWAGHFATLEGCKAGGPAASTIAEATAAIEARGVPVYHSIFTRERLAIPCRRQAA